MAKRAAAGAKGAGKANGAAKPKKTRAAKAPKAAAVTAGHNGDRESADAIRANFLQHRSLWNKAQASLKVAEKALKDMVASAKADGFLKKEFEIADDLAGSPKKEAKVVGEVKTRLRVARWIGHAMGNQYDLFENPRPALPTQDQAFDAGKQAAMEGLSATPPDHYPGEMSQAWLSGWHEQQETMVRTGIRPTAPPAADGDGQPGGWGASKLPAAARSENDL